MVRDEFDPSAAAVAINRAIQKGKRSKCSLDWDKIARAVYGLFSAVPMGLNYRDKELDLATTVCDMNGLLLQAPGGRFGRRDAEGALGLIRRFGGSADRRKTIGDPRSRTQGPPALTPRDTSTGPAASTGTGTTRVKATAERSMVFATTTARAVPGRRREPSAQLGASPGAGTDPPRAETSNAIACMMRRARYSLCIWCGTFEFGVEPCLLCMTLSTPRALRCDNWGRRCLGKASDFGPELHENVTPGSPAFVLGQQVAAFNRECKKLQADRVRAERTARADQGGQAGRCGAPYAATAALRRVAWGATEYEPDGPPAWAPRGGDKGGGRGGARRPVPALMN